jgi:hypothetical protein
MNHSDQIFRQCHTTIAIEAGVCPACGGELTASPGAGSDPQVPQEIDHRGIALPSRHAVGGIITPR